MKSHISWTIFFDSKISFVIDFLSLNKNKLTGFCYEKTKSRKLEENYVSVSLSDKTCYKNSRNFFELFPSCYRYKLQTDIHFYISRIMRICIFATRDNDIGVII